MAASHRTLRVLAWTRLQGALFDVALGLAIGLGIGLATSHLRICIAAFALLGMLAGLRWRAPLAARAIEREMPRLGSSLEALLESRGGALEDSLAGWIDARVRLPLLSRELKRTLICSLLAIAFGLAISFAIRSAQDANAHATQARSNSTDTASALSIHLRATPPAYSGQPPIETDDLTLHLLRGTTIEMNIRSDGRDVVCSDAGGSQLPLELHGSARSLSFRLDRSRTLRVSAGSELRLVQLDAIVDSPPEVALIEPAGDRVSRDPPTRMHLKAYAHDDIYVASLVIRWTLSQGHGEQTHFRSGSAEVQVHSSAAGVEAEGFIDPARVGMLRGDTLVVWAEATDGNNFDGPGRGRSGARIVRWEDAAVEMSSSSGGTRLPPPASPLSEKELLARTQRLLHASAAKEKRRATSLALAQDQRTIRTGFTGLIESQESAQELDVDDKEIAELGDRRGQALLAKAVASMWQAESALSIGEPAQAIAPERAAISALDAALGIERYSLRPDAQNKPVSEARRLRGDARELHPRLPPLLGNPEAARLASLARRLLLAAQNSLSNGEARSLADALWALPGASDVPSAALATKLYAATDPGSRSSAAREAGEALARSVRPLPEALSPIDAQEGSITARLDSLR